MNLLELKGVVRRDERQKDHGSGDDVRRVGKSQIEAAKKVEHKLRLRDGVANVEESISHLLDPLGVGIDGEITLGHRVECLTKDDDIGLLVRLKQVSNDDVEIVGSLIRLHGEVEDVVIGAAIYPAPDASIVL